MTKKSRNGESRRFSSRRKTEAVLRLLRGEDLDLLSWENGVVPARLSQWREDLLCGGQQALQQRPADLREEQTKDLQAKIVKLTMANELLHHQVQRQASGRLFWLGDRSHEHRLLALPWQDVWAATRLPGVGDQPFGGVCPTAFCGAALAADGRAAGSTRTERSLQRWGLGGAYSPGASHFALSWGRSPQSLGRAALGRDPHLEGAGAQPASAWSHRSSPWPTMAPSSPPCQT